MTGFWEDKNVFVTGAGGMVGGNVVEKLLDAKANVVALIRSKNPQAYFYSEGLDDRVVSAYGDLKDCARMQDIIGRYEISIILHLGAQPIVGAAFSNPLETLQTNITGTANILEATRRSNIEAVVVASSDKAYGKAKKLPYTEDMPMNGEGPYEVSKSCTDLLALSYAKTYDLPVSVTRFGNIYGSGDLNFNRIIPGAIRAGLLDETLDIRSDGKMVREYLFVDDVARGYLMLAENIAKTKGEAFNFGSGERLKVLDVVEKVGNVMGKQIKTKILNMPNNEIPEQYLSSEKVEKLLGWKAEFSIEKGLDAAVPWYKKILVR